MYTVKQVAEKLGISAHTVRFYDKEGLFPNLSRDEHNVRLFSDADLEWVHVVQCLRETGMPLAEVKAFVQLSLQGDATIPTRHQILQHQVRKVEEDLAAMERRINTLRKKFAYYDALVGGQKADEWNPGSEARQKEQPAVTAQPSPSVPA